MATRFWETTNPPWKTRRTLSQHWNRAMHLEMRQFAREMMRRTLSIRKRGQAQAKEASQLSPMITFVWLWKESRKRNARRERNSFRRECTSSREFKSKRMEDLPEERNRTN